MGDLWSFASRGVIGSVMHCYRITVTAASWITVIVGAKSPVRRPRQNGGNEHLTDGYGGGALDMFRSQSQGQLLMICCRTCAKRTSQCWLENVWPSEGRMELPLKEREKAEQEADSEKKVRSSVWGILIFVFSSNLLFMMLFMSLCRAKLASVWHSFSSIRKIPLTIHFFWDTSVGDNPFSLVFFWGGALKPFLSHYWKVFLWIQNSRLAVSTLLPNTFDCFWLS